MKGYTSCKRDKEKREREKEKKEEGRGRGAGSSFSMRREKRVTGREEPRGREKWFWEEAVIHTEYGHHHGMVTVKEFLFHSRFGHCGDWSLR